MGWTTETSPHHLWRLSMVMALPSGSGPKSHMNLFSKQHSQAETCTVIFSHEMLTVVHLAHTRNAGYEHQCHCRMHNRRVNIVSANTPSISQKQIRQGNHANVVHGVDKPDANNQMKRCSSSVFATQGSPPGAQRGPLGSPPLHWCDLMCTSWLHEEGAIGVSATVDDDAPSH